MLVIRIVLPLIVAGPLLGLAYQRGSVALAIVAAVVLAAGVVWALRRPLRERRLAEAPLRDDVKELLERHVAFFRGLDGEGQAQFQRRVQRLMGVLEFEAVGGEEFDLEAKVMALAGAAVIAHGLPDYTYRTRRSVLLYPDHFDDEYDVDGEHAIAGMVHSQGPILFSRRALHDGWHGDDAYNVSIHEWAHVMDLDDGFGDGVPGFAEDTERWDEVLDETLERIRRNPAKSALRAYGGKNRAETFAVALETFFERPTRMRKRDEAMYELLADALRQRP